MAAGAPREVDVLVIGAGPSGLAAAAALRRAGIAQVEVVDRESQAGGIPRHCHHTGFGLRDRHRLLTGPAYARAWVAQARDDGATVRTGVTVTGWAPRAGTATPEADPGSGAIDAELVSSDGLERVRAGAIVLATGARERPRTARLVPGDRGAGVFTTGQLQQLTYLWGWRAPRLGTTAVIVGAGHVAYSAVLTLRHAGVRVAAMITELSAHQSYAVPAAAARWRYRFPLLTQSRVEAVSGRPRVAAVQVRRHDGSLHDIACDTVVFTGDWVPDNELARRTGLMLDPGSRGPRVDQALRTSHPGVFAVGNLVHPVLTADSAARTGRCVVPAVLAHLRGEPLPAPGFEITTEGPLAWVAPSGIGLVGWAGEFVDRPVLVVQQGGQVVTTVRLPHRRIVAERPFRLPTRWQQALGPVGEVRLTLASAPVRLGRSERP